MNSRFRKPRKRRIVAGAIGLALVLALTVGVIPPALAQQESCLTMVVEGNGTTTPAPGEHWGPTGRTVGIQAIPADGWRFVGWLGEVFNPDSASTIVIVNT